MKRLGKGIIVAFSAILVVFIAVFAYSGGYDYFLKITHPLDYEEIVTENSSKYGIDPSLIYAIIKTESGFNKDAKSKAGALGLMQIMPDTFEWLQTHGDSEHLDSEYLSDPKTNIKYGTYFISFLLRRYGTEREAICAYNAGMGNVDKWLKDSSCSLDGKTLDYIPFKETRQYVEKVMKNRDTYNRLYYKSKEDV